MIKIIIGVLIIYLVLVFASASIYKYIFSALKGTELEETWPKSIKIFSIAYAIAAVIMAIVFSTFHFCF